MSKPKDVHVVRHGDDWAARRPSTERVSKVFNRPLCRDPD